MPVLRVPEIVYTAPTEQPEPERAWTEQPDTQGLEWTCVDIVAGLDVDGFVSANALAAHVATQEIKSTIRVSPSGSPIQLRYYQKEAVEAVFRLWEEGKLAPIIICPTGCHRVGQRVLMYDGSIKAVEDVCVGDRLMGPDSTPRHVLTLCQGTGPMVAIVPNKGAPWTVNEDHVLTLRMTRASAQPRYASELERTLDISVRDYQAKSKNFKHLSKLIRAAVDFPSRAQSLPLTPYFMGLYLADGTLSHPQVGVSKPDAEVFEACRSEAARFPGLRVGRHDGSSGCPTWTIARPRYKGGPAPQPNEILDILRDLGLMPCESERRFIPPQYKLASRSERESLLAGILDGDGHMLRGGFDATWKSRTFAEDVAFVARSLGLAAYVSECEKGCQNDFVGTYWRVSISGHTSRLPMRISRKIPAARRINKDVLRTGFKTRRTGTVEPYFGFVLDGDHRYLLDDFTVTHNSGKTLISAEIMRWAHESYRYMRPVFVAHRQELLDQTVAKVKIMAPDRTVGLVQAEHNEPDRQITVASLQTLAGKSGERIKQIIAAGAPALLVIDEAHHSTSDSYARVIAAFKEANPELRILGLTATPGRSDGTSLDRVFDCVAYQRTIYEMIDEGFLVPPVGVRVILDINLDIVDSESGDFVTKKLAKIVDQPAVNREVVKAWLENGQQRRTIAFCITKDHAANIAAEFVAAGYAAAVINEKTKAKDRKEIFQKFRDGLIKVLCSVEVLTEGFDEPSVECILMARPTQSQGLFSQCVGRGLRLFPGKEDCLVVDCTGNSGKYALAQLANLSGLEPPRPPGQGLPPPPIEEEGEEGVARVDGVTTHALDFKLRKREAKYAWREIPPYGWTLQIPKIGYFLVGWHGQDKTLATVRFHDMRAGKRDSAPITLMATPVDFELAYGLVEGEVQRLLGAKSSRARLKDLDPKDAAPEPFAFLEDGLETDVVVSEATLRNDAGWRLRPTTEPQREFLRKLGLKGVMPETQGEAGDLITVMQIEQDLKKREPATHKQLWYLRSNGIQYDDDITKNAAKKLILTHRTGSKP
jgi:superfamily II DNA or RNA helicase